VSEEREKPGGEDAAASTTKSDAMTGSASASASASDSDSDSDSGSGSGSASGSASASASDSDSDSASASGSGSGSASASASASASDSDSDSDSDAAVAKAAKLGRKVSRGIAWNLVGSAVSNGVRVLVLIALGRLLAPEETGLVAKAMTVLVFINVIRDLGLGSALVQHKQPSEAHLHTAFTVGFGISCALAAALAIAAEPIALAYRSPAIEPMLRWLAVMVVIRGLATAALQLSKRALDFRTIALSDTAGYTAGAICSVALAAAGHGPWSLIYGYLLETAIATAWVLRKYGTALRLRFDRAAFGELFRYGAGETVQTIANVIATQGDYVVVGRQLGDAALGFYQRAYELVRFPATTFSSVVGSVLFPAFARLQDDRAELARAFRRTLFATALFLLPASAVLIVLADEVIRVVLGPQWTGAVLPFRIMCLGMLFRTNYKVGGLVARARGDVYGVALTQVLYAVTIVGGAAISVRWGIAGVAATTTIAIWILFGALTWLALRHTALSWRQIFASHAAPLFVALLTTAAALAVSLPLRSLSVAPSLTLVASLAAAAIAFFTSAAVAARRRAPDGDDDWTWLLAQASALKQKLTKRRRRG
jgi:O-antigen/teichoic acid export membrane protein